jgi:hypothetical protein
MKTTKTNTAIKINFAGVDSAMHADASHRITLIDILRSIWNKYVDKVTVKEFRDQFTAYASGLGYGETHIKRILADVDELRIRKTSATMAETKKRKAAAKKKANPDKSRSIESFVSEVKARHFSKAELVKLIAALATL